MSVRLKTNQTKNNEAQKPHAGSPSPPEEKGKGGGGGASLPFFGPALGEKTFFLHGGRLNQRPAGKGRKGEKLTVVNFHKQITEREENRSRETLLPPFGGGGGHVHFLGGWRKRRYILSFSSARRGGGEKEGRKRVFLPPNQIGTEETLDASNHQRGGGKKIDPCKTTFLPLKIP